MHKYYKMDEQNQGDDSNIQGKDKKIKNKKKVKHNKQQESSAEAGSDSEENEDSDGDEVARKFYDEEGNFRWQPEANDDESSSSDESGDGEEGSEAEDEDGGDSDEDSAIWDEDADLRYGKVANEEDVGCRLALNKMDWDTVSALDLLALFSSLCSGDKVVHKVEIYPSHFGLERMKRDSLYGPPKEIFDPGEDAPTKNKRKQKKRDDSSDSDSDLYQGFEHEDDDDAAYNQTKLRKYEVDKLKYYYAVIHCNTPQTALYLYDEYNGFEFENTTMRLNMSFIPDDMKFT